MGPGLQGEGRKCSPIQSLKKTFPPRVKYADLVQTNEIIQLLGN